MLFTPHDLRYHLEEIFPAFYTYVHNRAQKELGSRGYDSNNVDQIVDHVLDQLRRFNILGGGDAPKTTLDELSDVQFNSYLNKIIKHKAIDLKRRRHVAISTFTELESAWGNQQENDLLNEEVEAPWTPPFDTPEKAALEAASRDEYRQALKHCIEKLINAPHQFEALMQELEEMGLSDLRQQVLLELNIDPPAKSPPIPHRSQHKDHAHRKLRYCLQQTSPHLTIVIALRLTEYAKLSTSKNEIVVAVKDLEQPAPSEDEEGRTLSKYDVQRCLKHLARQGIIHWNDEEIVRFSSVEEKHLEHYYLAGQE